MNDLVNNMKTSTVVLQSLKSVGRDISDGIIAVTHNALALIGFGVLLAALLVVGRPDARHSVEMQAFSWLQSRLVSNVSNMGGSEEPALELSLPVSNAGLVLQAQMEDLPKQQKLVAEWLSKRYRIAPDPMAHMVAAAYETAGTLKLDPLLVLAVAAIESSFNPFVQSGVGAQGLMQVMSTLHEEKFERFGGTNAAFDPVTSIKVGAVILKEYVSRAGGVEGGLKMYVGAANFDTDGGYGHRVVAERMKLTEVAAGKRVPVFNAPIAVAVLNSNEPSVERTFYMPPQSRAQDSLPVAAVEGAHVPTGASDVAKRDSADGAADSKLPVLKPVSNPPTSPEAQAASTS